MTNNETGKELLSADEAASKLKITKATLLKWARQGKIERVKISAKVVLFTAEALDKFLQDRTNEVESKPTNYKDAVRTASVLTPLKKGGGKKNTGESWRDLRQKDSSWD